MAAKIIDFPEMPERIMAKIKKGSRIDQLDLYAILVGSNPLGPDDHEYIWPDTERRLEVLEKYDLLLLSENARYFGPKINQLLLEHQF